MLSLVSSLVRRSVAGLALAAGVVMALGAPAAARGEDLAVQPGEQIIFFGDSITEQGGDSPTGFVNLVSSGLEAKGVTATASAVGIYGHVSNSAPDRLLRLKTLVLDKKPDWMVFSCGTDDVFKDANGLALEPFRENVAKIIAQAQAANIKVMILTATMVGEDPASATNKKLVAYNDFLRLLAGEKKCLLVDLNADMQAAVKAARAEGKDGHVLTVEDGVHLNEQGNQLVAAGILKSFSANAAKVAGAPAAIVVKTGDKIAFLGDSITQFGDSPNGYVRLVIKGLEANGVKATAIPAGVSGHKSNDMLARLKTDVLDKKPDWMTLSCGVNDVWHGVNGVPLDKYKENITKIVDEAQAAHIKVMILTSTMIGEQPNENNTKLAAYNDFLRTLAKSKKCLLADLNADMQAGIKAAGKPCMTVDGVHMNDQGNQMMALGVLRTFGANAARLAKAQAAWKAPAK